MIGVIVAAERLGRGGGEGSDNFSLLSCETSCYTARYRKAQNSVTRVSGVDDRNAMRQCNEKMIYKTGCTLQLVLRQIHST